MITASMRTNSSLICLSQVTVMVRITSYLLIDLPPLCHPKMLTHIYFLMTPAWSSLKMLMTVIYQEGRVYDEDEDWWNEFCVPDLEEPEWVAHRSGPAQYSFQTM